MDRAGARWLLLVAVGLPLVLLTPANVCALSGWPQGGRDPGRTRRAPVFGPSTIPTIAWQSPAGVYPRHIRVAEDGKILAVVGGTDATNPADLPRVVCLRPNGTKLWQYDAPNVDDRPAADLVVMPGGRVVFVGDRHAHFLSLADGRFIAGFERAVTPGHPMRLMGGSLTYEGTVVVAEQSGGTPGGGSRELTADATVVAVRLAAGCPGTLDPLGNILWPGVVGDYNLSPVLAGPECFLFLEPVASITLERPDGRMSRRGGGGGAVKQWWYRSSPGSTPFIWYGDYWYINPGLYGVIGQPRIGVGIGRRAYVLGTEGTTPWLWAMSLPLRRDNVTPIEQFWTWKQQLAAGHPQVGIAGLVVDAASNCYAAYNTDSGEVACFSADGTPRWRWAVGQRIVDMVMGRSGELILGLEDGRIVATTPGQAANYRIQGMVLLPYNTRQREVTVELGDLGGVVRTLHPDGRGRFDFGPANGNDYYVRPVLDGWRFEPLVQSSVAAATDQLVFVGEPLPTPASSTTTWDVTAGLSVGAWLGLTAKLGPLGASAAKISGTCNSDFGLEVAMETDPGGSKTLYMTPHYGQGSTIGAGLGPEGNLGPMSVKPAELEGEVKAGLTTSSTFAFDRVLPEQGSTSGQQQAMAVLLLGEPLVTGPARTTPGFGLFVNGALTFLTGVLGHEYLDSVGIVFQASSSTGLNIGQFGVKSKQYNKGANVTLAGGSVTTTLEASFDKYFNQASADPSFSGQVSLAVSPDVSFLSSSISGLQSSGDEKWSASLPSLLPQLGATGLVYLRSDFSSVLSALPPQTVAVGVTVDKQQPEAVFSSVSDAQTMEVGIYGPQAVAALANGGAAMHSEILAALTQGRSLPGLDWQTFSSDLSRMLVSAFRYAQDQATAPIGYVEKSREKGRGSSFDFSLDLGAGLGVTVGASGSYMKSYSYTERRGDLWLGPLWAEVHDTSTVPPEDARNFASLAGNIISAAADTLLDVLEGLLDTAWGAISDLGNAVANAADGLAEVVVEGDTSHKGYSVGMESYDPTPGAGVGSSAVLPQRVLRPYRHLQVTPAQTGSWALQDVVSVGKVRHIVLKRPSGSIYRYTSNSKITLKVKVREADLQARGLSASLLPQVTICRYNKSAKAWDVLATTREGQDTFVAKADKAGEYMPAVVTSAVDTLPPALISTEMTDGAKLRPGEAVSFHVADRPDGLNLGLAPGGVYFTVDGKTAAGSLEVGADGVAEVSFVAPAGLPTGDHQLRLVATDRGDHQATFGPWKFSVRPAADLNDDGKVDGADLARFLRAWRKAHAAEPEIDTTCDVAPLIGEMPNIMPAPDGKIDEDDAAVFLDFYLQGTQ